MKRYIAIASVVAVFLLGTASAKADSIFNGMANSIRGWDKCCSKTCEKSCAEKSDKKCAKKCEERGTCVSVNTKGKAPVKAETK